MAKKRTLKPFWGKREQRWEHAGREAMRNGHHDQARELLHAADAGSKVKMMHGARHMAHRPIGRFLHISAPVRAFIRGYSRGR